MSVGLLIHSKEQIEEQINFALSLSRNKESSLFVFVASDELSGLVEPAPGIEVVSFENFQDLPTKLEEHDVSLFLTLKPVGKAESEIFAKLYEEVPSTVLLFRLSNDFTGNFSSVLVPVNKGANAKSALKIASAIEDVSITALYVADSYGELAAEVAESTLRETIKKAKLSEEVAIEKKVVVSSDVLGTIGTLASGYDLILIGSSEQSQLRKLLFGTIPDKVLSSESERVVGVVRSPHTVSKKLLSRVLRLVDLTVPQLGREERLQLFKKVAEGSFWSFDFLTLIVLSTLIATIGLIQNSTAVVIGAMLVAPLMTPLLGAGLSLAQMNLVLFKKCTKSVIFGFLVAVATASFVGLIFPFALNNEIVSRTGPSILDLIVALSSGVAAAYCLARPTLGAALPGVAIAAALVPPIGVLGLGIATLSLEITYGAGLLFATNILSIVLGSYVSFYGAGIRPAKSESWGHVVGLVLFLALMVLAIPLTSVLLTKGLAG